MLEYVYLYMKATLPESWACPWMADSECTTLLSFPYPKHDIHGTGRYIDS